MAKHKMRLFFWGGAAAAAGALALSYWLIALFNQLDMVTAARVLNKPVRYYSDISALKTGRPLTLAAFEARLLDRGYKKQIEGELKEGAYRIFSGEPSLGPDEGVEVFFRAFIAPDGRATAGLYRFVFSRGVIAAIEQFPSGKVKKEVMLEPMLLGDTRSGGVEIRPWASLNSVPRWLKEAVLDSEDRRFYSHHGVDPIGIARAFFVNITKLGVRQGGSTLTQQLVRNAFLSQKRTYSRKITEALIALIIELRYTKEQILELYLNQIYLGKNGYRAVYGVEDASLSYFGKHVSRLSLAECALIAGLIPSPTRSNPRSNPALALERRNNTIKALFKNKRISFDEAQEAFSESPAYAPAASSGIGSYYIDYVRQLLEQEYGIDVLEARGYRVYTALDPELEAAAEKALAAQEYEGAVVALDAYTGFVRALAGGRDFGRTPFNRAVLAKRSPGSAFKPLIFAAGLEYEYFKEDSLLQDKPVRVRTAGKDWQPQNYDGKYLGSVTYRDALVFSRNIPAVEVLQAVGAGRVSEFAAKMGIQSTMTIVPSLALGTSGVTPLEMTAAYAPFANGGSRVKPVFIRWITDPSGRIIKENKPELTEVISAKTAGLITDILKEAVDRGTGRNVRKLGYAGPAAGKTGTSDYFYDAWFIGYTPDILCGVWLGNDQPSSLGNAASETAVPVWTGFVKSIVAPQENAVFGRRYPPGIKGFFQKLFGK